MDKKIINNYRSLQSNLKGYARTKGISISHVCRKSGISRTTFDRKLKAQRFFPDELEKIIEIINN
jgi:DNA-binding phage protein